MRPADEVSRDVVRTFPGNRAAVIVADREALVREICEMLRTTGEFDDGGWVVERRSDTADEIERKYLGKDA